MGQGDKIVGIEIMNASKNLDLAQIQPVNFTIVGHDTGIRHMEQWIRELLERQAARQREDANLPWPEKLRISAAMWMDLEGFRKEKKPGPSSPPRADSGTTSQHGTH